ncbi:MAG TPA: hypothetical protein VFA78_05980 [Chloroflexota bacterium]|nr:hypothetical protein [Chloroflexota bacterium]
MDAAQSRPFFRRGPLYSYAAYSIACFIVWGIIWAIYLLGIAKTNALGTILAIFLGWVIGWTSATIARYVYPPPKKWGGAASGLHG